MSSEVSKDEWLADEVIILRDGGEMPEVAFHSAIFFLTRDDDGPGLILDEGDLRLLKEAVVARYRWIILRDLLPENRFTSIYRGLERSCANFHRLRAYGAREGLAVEEVRLDAAQALVAFLRREHGDVVSQGQESAINCSPERLQYFAADLGLDLEREFPQWPDLFS
ncbi:MAG: hypothetical protein ABFR97_06480 [Thermodesulfobacteriota bacterium]